MKLFAPKYYKDFKCIAERCRHSCCIGWEIDVDGAAMEKYSMLSGGYGEEIRKSIDTDGVPHFRLGAGERCPHLDEKGLCRIITEMGEGYLCDICREHPRFYNNTALGKEVGLGMACEEACRIILSSDSYAEMTVIGEVSGEIETDFDVLPYRKKIFSILSNGSLSFSEKLLVAASEHGLDLDARTDGQWREIISSLEYLDEARRELFLCYSSHPQPPKSLEKPLERALAYFVYRHCSSAENKADFRASLGFCLVLTALLASLVSGTTGEITELARIVSEEIEYSEDNVELIKQEFWF